MAGSPSVVVITPVRDEARYIEQTMASMESQTLRPTQWIIVDDGSTDGTARLASEHAAKHAWVSIVTLPDRGYRAAGSGVMHAFYAGYAAIRDADWRYLVKLDGDLSFSPTYLEQCVSRFVLAPQLGIAGGTVCRSGAEVVVDSPGDPPFHVRGATKIYRRECWDLIAPLLRAPGWDTVDEVRANMRGWATRTFPDLVVLQHKPTGSADGCWRNALKNGFANYVAGYHPAFMLAKCVKRSLRRPLLVESTGLGVGFCAGYFATQGEVADAETVRFLRVQQLRRMTFRRSIYG
jgi:poly-beta-1,6-N-acetyl-D-glucosamine synthase